MAFWRCLLRVLAHRRSALSAYALRDLLLGCIQVDLPGQARFPQEFIARQYICLKIFRIFLSILAILQEYTLQRCKINRLGGWILHTLEIYIPKELHAKFSPLIYLFCNALCNMYSWNNWRKNWQEDVETCALSRDEFLRKLCMAG